MELSDIINDKSSNINDIAKDITIKHVRCGKINRTQIYGLNSYINDETITIYSKELKKKLGTMCVLCEDDVGQFLGFQGNHIDSIYKYLLSKKIISSQKIKK
jgi:translation initiation factor 1 (eIF-1/SUI1)